MRECFMRLLNENEKGRADEIARREMHLEETEKTDRLSRLCVASYSLAPIDCVTIQSKHGSCI